MGSAISDAFYEKIHFEQECEGLQREMEFRLERLKKQDRSEMRRKEAEVAQKERWFKEEVATSAALRSKVAELERRLQEFGDGDLLECTESESSNPFRLSLEKCSITRFPSSFVADLLCPPSLLFPFS